MKTTEIEQALNALPVPERKRLAWQSTRYAFRQRQTWIALLVYFGLIIGGSVMGEIFKYKIGVFNLPFLVGNVIGFILFLFTFAGQRQRGIGEALKNLRPPAAG